jgi:hypothetical protein
MKVADLTTEERRELIGTIIEEKLKEMIDPDLELEFREDFVRKLEASIKSKERISFEDMKKKLDLN